MQKYCLWLIALFIIGAPVPAHAETLDDATIHKIFADMEAAIRDPVKTRELMQARLDDKYVLKSNVTSAIDTDPPKEVLQVRKKAEAIDDTVKSMDKMKIDKYESNISSIQYSGDKKFASVNEVSTTSGTTTVSNDKGSPIDFTYDGQETCSHILALAGDQVKIMQSQCEDKIVFKQKD